jgi:hypothetical protein
VRCTLAERARQLVGDTTGPLAPLYQAIIAAPKPHSAHNWLRTSASAALLADITAGTMALTHEALDAHHSRAAEFLRRMLVANAVLPARDDALVRLETWVDDRLDEVASAQQRRLLRSYATWRVLRQARRRAEAAGRPRTPTRHAKTYLLAAVALLAFLDDRGRTLASCTQADLDAWLADGPPSAHEAADFLAWAADRHLSPAALTITRPQPHPQPDGLDDDTRWAIVARLLHDDNLELVDRVAGCLVLLYGQQLTRIVALTRHHISTGRHGVSLRLGATPIEIPEPLADLVTRLVTTRRPYTGIGSPADQPWLFPGLDPGHPLTASHLGQRLRRLGISTLPGRRRALTHLAARLPAAVLADLLNLAPTTAVRWVRTAGGDWSTYAAQVIRDRDREP